MKSTRSTDLPFQFHSRLINTDTKHLKQNSQRRYAALVATGFCISLLFSFVVRSLVFLFFFSFSFTLPVPRPTCARYERRSLLSRNKRPTYSPSNPEISITAVERETNSRHFASSFAPSLLRPSLFTSAKPMQQCLCVCILEIGPRVHPVIRMQGRVQARRRTYEIAREWLNQGIRPTLRQL